MFQAASPAATQPVPGDWAGRVFTLKYRRPPPPSDGRLAPEQRPYSLSMFAAPPAEEVRPRWRRAAPALLASFVAGRVIVLVAALAAEAGRPLDVATTLTDDGARVLWTSAPLLRSLTSWDGVYYLGIATGGYHVGAVNGPYPDTVFFPLLPALIRVGSSLTGLDPALVGVLIANVALAIALPLLYMLGVRVLGDEARALRAAALMGIAAGGTAFSIAYSDAVFLVLALVAFLVAERGRAGLTGILYAAATLTRLPGIALGLPLAMVLLARNPFRLGDLAWLLLGPLALAGFLGYVWNLTGDPLAVLHGQASWDAPRDAGGYPGGPIEILGWNVDVATGVILAGAALGSLLLLATVAIAAARRAQIPWPYVALGLLWLGSIVLSLRVVSSDRYLAVAWPILWVLATPRRRLVRLGWPFASATALFALSYASFLPALPP